MNQNTGYVLDQRSKSKRSHE